MAANKNLVIKKFVDGEASFEDESHVKALKAEVTQDDVIQLALSPDSKKVFGDNAFEWIKKFEAVLAPKGFGGGGGVRIVIGDEKWAAAGTNSEYKRSPKHNLLFYGYYSRNPLAIYAPHLLDIVVRRINEAVEIIDEHHKNLSWAKDVKVGSPMPEEHKKELAAAKEIAAFAKKVREKHGIKV